LIRRAVPADSRAIAEVHVRAWRAGYAGLLPQELLDGLSTNQRARDWSARLGSGAAGLTVVAEEDGAVVGFCTLFGREIAALYVDPDRWRRGIGGALLREALAGAGEGEVTLWVMAGNVAALRFYERFGFVRDGAEKRDLIGPAELQADPRQVRLRRAQPPK
jgi:ribosomal protein S18 acetylase RimI-like enzyme